MEKINICVTVNSLYVRYLYIMLLSLFESNENGKISLFVLQKDFTTEDKELITSLSEKYGNEVYYIWIDPNKVKELPQTFCKANGLSVEILFRLLIPECIPENIDRVLLLDVDIIVNKPLDDLFFADLGECILAAVPNMGSNGIVEKRFRDWYPSDRKSWTHYNTGVLLWNLKKIRATYPKEYFFKKAITYTNILKPEFEEEFFNVEFGESKIKDLSVKWNYQPRVLHRPWILNKPNFEIYADNESIRANCGIIHYVTTNPWAAGIKDPGYSLWWDYCKKTPFFAELQEKVYIQTEKRLAESLRILEYMDALNNEECMKGIRSYLFKNGINRVLILGAGSAGKMLAKKLMESEISVVAVCDISYFRQVDARKEMIVPIYDYKDIGNFKAEYDAIIASGQFFYDALDEKTKKQERIIHMDDLIWR